MKPVVTPLPAANAPLVFDEWTYHDPEKQCDARAGCKKPQSDNVDWVCFFYCFVIVVLRLGRCTVCFRLKSLKSEAFASCYVCIVRPLCERVI